jgi:hypothetical protein
MNQNAPAALSPPVFEKNVYSVSPYGAAVGMNSAYYASAEAANELAQMYGAIAVELAGSPEEPELKWWNTVAIPASLLMQVATGQVATASMLMTLRSLPTAKQWCLRFANGVIFNAGYLARYWLLNPPSIAPGYADKMCRWLLTDEGVVLPPPGVPA